MITEMYRKPTYESEDTYSGADEPELYTSTAEGTDKKTEPITHPMIPLLFLWFLQSNQSPNLITL